MAKTLKNKRLYKYNRFYIPQEMIDICFHLKIAKYLVNYFGDRGFVIKKLEDTESYRIHHHVWGEIANPKHHINEWEGEEVKKYFIQVHRFKNKSDHPEDDYSRIMRERWFIDKDLQIVMEIYKHRIMNTSQLTALGIYKNKSAARQIRARCKQLTDNHVLESFQPAQDELIGAAENHYMLGEVGAYIVSKNLNKTIKEIGWTPRHNEIMMHTIYHTIEINNVFLAYRNHKQLGDSTFPLEVVDTEAEYLISEQVEDSKGKVRFNPDGLMILKYENVQSPFFLEVDRNTMSLVDFAAKVPRYEAYARSRNWEKKFGSFPPVLVCTTDEKRMIELARTVNNNQNSKLKQLPWLFTTLDLVKEKPLETIWIMSQEAKEAEFTYYSIMDAFK